MVLSFSSSLALDKDTPITEEEKDNSSGGGVLKKADGEKEETHG